ETIISRGILNTRMKDYYDLYMFVNHKFESINIEILKEAIINTAKRRDTLHLIKNKTEIINLIENSENIKKLWIQYQLKFEYASKILFEDVIKSVKIISNKL
ncbi:MAG: nucleotidyl transferase AbiEii/AbiGii toxin family protein, partial [Bacilli bacterium]